MSLLTDEFLAKLDIAELIYDTKKAIEKEADKPLHRINPGLEDLAWALCSHTSLDDLQIACARECLADLEKEYWKQRRLREYGFYD